MEIIKQKKRFLYGFISILLVSLYYITYFNKFFPLAEGWYANYANLVLNGKLPYKDFYYFLPPFNMLTDILYLKISSGSFFIMRSIRLLERIFIVTLLYIILSKSFKYKYAAFSCFIGGIVGSGATYDILGDYSQTVMIWLLFILICIIKFVSTQNLKYKIRQSLYIGIILGILFYVKQNSFAIFLLVFFIGLIGYSIKLKDKNLFKYCLSVIIGILLVLGIVSLIMLKLNILTPFLEQVYFSNAKGGNPVGIIIKPILKVYLNSNLSFYLALTVFILCYSFKDNSNKTLILLEKILFLSMILSIFYQTVSIRTLVRYKATYLFILVVILILFINYSFNKMEKFKNFKNYLNFINFAGFGILVYFSWLYQSQIYNLVNTGLLFRHITAFNYYFLILECLFYLSKLNVNSTKNSIIYFILIAAIAEGFSSSLSSVTYINERTMLILLPVALVIIMSTINLSITDKFFIYFMPLTLISLCFVKKLQQPYEWWGYKEQPISTKNFSTDIPSLKGIKFSKEEAKLYEEMVKVIDSNSTSETTILGYPYVQIFSVLTNHTEINRFVPVYFYDVCPDEMAIEDAKRLKETPPDIIIYMDIPGCMHEHEQIYRNGSECGQREIVKFIKDETENNYSLIGQIANLYVFKDLKGKNPNYTYIEDNDISRIFDDIK